MKTGDRVVCVIDNPNFPPKDSEFIVSDTATCPSCRRSFIAIGIPCEKSSGKCGCGFQTTGVNPRQWYYQIEGFRKVEEKREYKVVKSNIEIEEPVLS